jgi:hypothetical protein
MALAIGTVATSAPANAVIEPFQAIAGARLGDTPAQLIAAKGQPRQVSDIRVKGAGWSQVWQYGRDDRATTVVINKRGTGRVISVSTRSPQEWLYRPREAAGIGIGSTLDEFRDARVNRWLPCSRTNPKRLICGYDVTDPGEEDMYFTMRRDVIVKATVYIGQY